MFKNMFMILIELNHFTSIQAGYGAVPCFSIHTHQVKFPPQWA